MKAHLISEHALRDMNNSKSMKGKQCKPNLISEHALRDMNNSKSMKGKQCKPI